MFRTVKRMIAIGVVTTFAVAAIAPRPAEAGLGALIARIVAKTFTRSAPRFSHYRPNALPRGFDAYRPSAVRPQVRVPGHIAEPFEQVIARAQVETAMHSPAMQKAIQEGVRIPEGLKGAAAHKESVTAIRNQLETVMAELHRTRYRHSRHANTEALAKHLTERLETLAAREASTANPRFVFEAASGKLTIPSGVKIAGGEIIVGEFNAYKLMAVFAAGATCVHFECTDSLRTWAFKDLPGGDQLDDQLNELLKGSN